MIPTAPLPKNRLLDLEADVGITRSAVRWDLTDRTGSPVGEIHPDALTIPQVTNDAYATYPRTLRNLTIPGYEAQEIDFYTTRLAPRWVLEDGTEWPLGVFIWQEPTRTYRTWDSPLTSTLVDLSYVLDQAHRESFGLTAGAVVSEAIVELWEAAGLTDYEVQGSDVRAGEAIGWPVGTSRRQMMVALHGLCGWPPPWFDNTGCGHSGPLPPLRDGQNVCRYVIDGTASRVVEGSAAISPDTSNKGAALVIGTGATKGEISALVFVDPSLPWSQERRGFLTIKKVEMQGIASTEQATNIALAELDMQVGAAIGFSSIPDPRHDTHNVVEFGAVGDLYREIAWTLPCTPGGPMTHQLVKGAG